MNFSLCKLTLALLVFGSSGFLSSNLPSFASVLEFRSFANLSHSGAYLDGQRVDAINGTPYFYHVTDDGRGQFVFQGDLNLTGIEQVVAHHYDVLEFPFGDIEILKPSLLPVSVLVANDVTIGRETTINISAIGRHGVAGGGTGGHVGQGGNGGAGGRGGEEHKLATMSHNGGVGHDYTVFGGIGDGTAGGGGDMGGLGQSGDFGGAGQVGGNATSGFGHSSQEGQSL